MTLKEVMDAEQTTPDKPPLPKKKIHWKHYLLHSMTAIFVFAAGVGADVAIIHYLKNRPRTVRWTSGLLETNYFPGRFPLPPPGGSFDVGVMDDGIVVWRATKGKQ